MLWHSADSNRRSERLPVSFCECEICGWPRVQVNGKRSVLHVAPHTKQGRNVWREGQESNEDHRACDWILGSKLIYYRFLGGFPCSTTFTSGCQHEYDMARRVYLLELPPMGISADCQASESFAASASRNQAELRTRSIGPSGPTAPLVLSVQAYRDLRTRSRRWETPTQSGRLFQRQRLGRPTANHS
jgi:hypothetical protein